MAKAKRGAKKVAKKSAKKSASPRKKALKRITTKKPTAKKSAPKKNTKKSIVKKSAAKLAKLAFGTIEQIEHFSASPEVVYHALMDGKLHAAFTGAVAKIAGRVGGAFSAWGGYIKGHVLELVPGEKIVQAWRTTDFPREYPDSNLEIRLTPESGGTRLRLLHSNVPEKSVESYHSGWHDNYWQPLRAWLSTLPPLDLAPTKKSKSKKSKSAKRR